MQKVVFPKPHFFEHFSQEETAFRARLPDLLEKECGTVDFAAVKQITLLPESEASIVYKIVLQDGQTNILKISSNYEGLIAEALSLSKWHEEGIQVPEIQNIRKAIDGGFEFGMVTMHFIEGTNLREAMKDMPDSQTEVIKKELGTILAKMHTVTGHGYGKLVIKDDKEIMARFSTFTEYVSEGALGEAYIVCKQEKLFENDFWNTYSTALTTVSNYFIRNKPSLLHGDYRAGNFLLNDEAKIVLIDPSPLLGHPYFDLCYNLILDDAYDERSDNNSFVNGYAEQAAIRPKELLASLVLEGTRMCASWYKQADKKPFERMRLITEKASNTLDGPGNISDVFLWMTR